VPSVRFSRDKRGYEYVYLVHTPTRRGKPGRTRVLYWYRTPPGVRIGRKPFDEEVQRMLEQQNPGVTFDWEAIIGTPMPPPDMTEFWRERRRAEKAARQERRAAEAAEAVEPDELDVDEPVTAVASRREPTAAIPRDRDRPVKAATVRSPEAEAEPIALAPADETSSDLAPIADGEELSANDLDAAADEAAAEESVGSDAQTNGEAPRKRRRRRGGRRRHGAAGATTDAQAQAGSDRTEAEGAESPESAETADPLEPAQSERPDRSSEGE
jgi:hypothetical protein